MIDLPITPDRDGLWTNKRMPDHVAPLEEVTWVADDGIRYLNPEIALLFKAVQQRPKDERDLDRCLPAARAGGPVMAAGQRRSAVSRPRVAGSPLLTEPDRSVPSEWRTIRPGRNTMNRRLISAFALTCRPLRARGLRSGDRSPGGHRRRRPGPHRP